MYLLFIVWATHKLPYYGDFIKARCARKLPVMIYSVVPWRLQYERNDVNFIRNKFRVRGDVVEIFPAQSSDAVIRVEFFGDEIDRISEINPVDRRTERQA